MIILGIDSSTDRLAVGLADNGRIIFEDRLDSLREHASQIIGLIDSVMSRAPLAKEKLEGVVVAVGPGSFTGLRIGMAAAKGIALALNLPIVGVSTFEVIARRLLPEYKAFSLTAMVRRDEFYLCHVMPDADIRKNIDIVSRLDLPQRVGSEPVGIIGRRPESWPELIKNPIPFDKTDISGGELAVYGAEMITAGQIADTAALEPLYIAPSQAELKFGRK
jgi:tRNA threonylcarbamoyladenosine biosynthesis protein TsaB